MSDTKDNRLSCEEIEELVPELLYGELDDARAEQVRAQLPECELDGKVAAYERMREAFRSLPDEEPPAAITAQLLHAAAKQVQGKSATDGEGFWSKLRGWFAPIVMSPGFAAAASILVIGGVVGVLYMKSADQRAPADVPTRAAPPAERAPAHNAPAGTATPALEGRLMEQAEGEEALDEDEIAADETVAVPPPPPVAKEQKPSPARGKGGRAANRDRADKDVAGFGVTGESTGLLGGDSGGGSYKQGAKSAETLGPVRRGDDAEAPQAPAADPAPEPEPAPDDAPAPPKSEAKKRAPSKSKQPADPHADARRLHNQARSLAERGDCTATRKLTAQIKKIDAVYYRNSVVGDRQLSKCNVVSK